MTMKHIETQDKYNLILKHDKTNDLFNNLQSSGMGYDWEEITEIAYAYALYLENNGE